MLDSLMITSAQMRAARALLAVDQRQLAQLAGLSVPTIQRMEASDGIVRSVVGSLEKVVNAFNAAGVELITAGSPSYGTGRGVRLLERAPTSAQPKTGLLARAHEP
jgi:DNA-binding XRE family transcriptional regulator